MEISCTKNDLLNGINIVSKAVSTKTTKQILQCILIDAEVQGIRLVGNDMDLGIQTVIPGMIEEKGMIAVDASIFSAIIRKMPEEDIHISVTGENIGISCGKSNFTIPGRDGREFTMLPDVDREQEIVMTEFMLKDIITKTIFSISDNESNRMMTGELLEICDGFMRMVSLDGHRISIRKVQLGGDFKNRRVVVPGKTMSEVSKILGGDMEKKVHIFFSPKHIVFEFDSTLVVSRLLDGEYFEIDQMISRDYETRITINRKVFLDAIDRTTLLIKEGDKKPIVLSISDDQMEINVKTPIGRMREKVDLTKTGRDIMIGFNPKFVLDALRAIDDEEVSIYMLNSKVPCFIRNEEETYNYVVLPVNFTVMD